MIEIKNISKKFGDRAVLEDISATFNPGTTSGVSVNSPLPAGSTRQSAPGLGSLAGLTLPSSFAVRNVLSGR